ncbi:hypothetical protein [Halomarina pelagica]|uniref:hypothetical protein n=1 Tax=Halomarina pelagica TaxID=2961599 RepID=UPI0020C1D276|nr:hypothetical protein [Halomarina sp. BND7]
MADTKRGRERKGADKEFQLIEREYDREVAIVESPEAEPEPDLEPEAEPEEIDLFESE